MMEVDSNSSHTEFVLMEAEVEDRVQVRTCCINIANNILACYSNSRHDFNFASSDISQARYGHLGIETSRTGDINILITGTAFY